MELRDGVNTETFKILVLQAASTAIYQKEVRQSQLRITYTLLFYLGVRLNELRLITLEEIEESLETEILKITLFKTNTAHTARLVKAAIRDLKKLERHFDILHRNNFKYLFGKRKPLHSKALLRIVNEDLAATCKTFKINKKISSHSFRIGLISRLLMTNNIQDVKCVIGHKDIRSTMIYSRYKLTKDWVQAMYDQAGELD